jgi:hypothetical protein
VRSAELVGEALQMHGIAFPMASNKSRLVELIVCLLIFPFPFSQLGFAFAGFIREKQQQPAVKRIESSLVCLPWEHIVSTFSMSTRRARRVIALN